MVDNRNDQLDTVFQALSDPTRRAMLAHLAHGKCTVSDLPNPLGVTKAAISKHVAILHKADLLEKKKEGRKTLCFAKLSSLDEAYRLLDNLGQFWRSQLDSLERYFDEETIKENENERKQKQQPVRRRKKNRSR